MTAVPQPCGTRWSGREDVHFIAHYRTDAALRWIPSAVLHANAYYAAYCERSPTVGIAFRSPTLWQRISSTTLLSFRGPKSATSQSALGRQQRQHNRPAATMTPCTRGGRMPGLVAFVVPTQRPWRGSSLRRPWRAPAPELRDHHWCRDMPIRPPRPAPGNVTWPSRRRWARRRRVCSSPPTQANLACADPGRSHRGQQGARRRRRLAQAFALRHKIREVEQAGVGGLIEVHLELTFHLLGARRFPEAQLGRRPGTMCGSCRPMASTRGPGSRRAGPAWTTPRRSGCCALTAARHADGTAIRFPARRRGPAIWA